jgi:DNA modification methylase
MRFRIITADVMEGLAQLPDESVHCCVTSPPYWGLRDYGVAGQIGLEATPDAFVAEMVAVFREVRRVLRKDGTLWLNLGDSYAANRTYQVSQSKHKALDFGDSNASKVPDGLKPKDLIGVPWRVAFALQADGWYLRQDIIWSKPNPMPESVTDRCTKAHEYIFLMSKSAKYYYDASAIAEAGVVPAGTRRTIGKPKDGGITRAGAAGRTPSGNEAAGFTIVSGTRNKRSVWEVTTQPFKQAHFATFPPELIEPCIRAGSPVCGTILDPFGGSGTTGLVADRFGRDAILIELNPEYAAMAKRRIEGDAGMFADVS